MFASDFAEAWAASIKGTPLPPKPVYEAHWHQPRTLKWTCKGPGCGGEVQGIDKLPNYFTAATCWNCDSDEETHPRPVTRKEDS